MSWLILWLFACTGANTYIVEGTVLEVHEDSVTLDHKDIEGLMSAMIMDFDVSDPALLEGLVPGHQVVARYALEPRGGQLTKIRITGKGPPPKVKVGPMSVQSGKAWPRTEVTGHDGATFVVGAGQERPTALTFLYTRCPIPEMCPALVGRLQALQAQLTDDDDVQLVALTLDPTHDTVEVLGTYAESVGAGPKWRFGRVAAEQLPDMALLAGMNVVEEGEQIIHGLRLLVLDGEGRLIERYDDARFPADRVLTQLRTGGPPAPEGSSGTSSPPN